MGYWECRYISFSPINLTEITGKTEKEAVALISAVKDY